DDGVRLLLHVGDHVAVREVVLVEGEAPLRARRDLGRHPDRVPLAGQAGGGELAPHALTRRAPLVEPDADTDRAIALALRDPEGLQLAEIGRASCRERGESAGVAGAAE